MNTTMIGDGFRDKVAELLRTRYHVETEYMLGGTKIDLLFERPVFAGNPERVAIECKNYTPPLTKHQLSTEIWPTYGSLLQTYKDLRLIIVSRRPLGAAAAEYLRETMRGASHRTFDELAEEMLDLRQYVRSLAELKPNEESEYIEARFERSADSAFDVIQRWEKQGAPPGLAVLGGYGQGKSSLARRVAGHYAKENLNDPSVRVPVLIRLGELVHEIQLEGLFAKEFTHAGVSKSFTFPTFIHLNRLGRLLIILDGFDEMKHAMSANDFEATFLQFNRLLQPDARVLLLGRPNVLGSEETELFLHGKKHVGETLVRSAQYQPWLEHKLAFFEPQESRSLLCERIRRLIQSRSLADGKAAPAELESFIASRIATVFEHVGEDLIKRPVHVMLVGELAAEPDFDFRGFNVFKLYDYFISSMVNRDTSQKTARSPIKLDSRLQFQRELAWWAWTRKGEVQGWFSRLSIPQGLLNGLPNGNASDKESLLNEYVVATLTEVKDGGMLGFAHRSFQEFLVATRMMQVIPTPPAHAEHARILNDEIATFLKLATNQSFWKPWYQTLCEARGPLTLKYLALFAEQIGKAMPAKLIEFIQPDGSNQAVPVLVCCLAVRSLHEDDPQVSILVEYYLRVIQDDDELSALAAVLAVLDVHSRRRDSILLDRLVAAVMSRCLRRAPALATGRGALAVHTEGPDALVIWLSDRVIKTRGILQVNLATLVDVIQRRLVAEVKFLADLSEELHLFVAIKTFTQAYPARTLDLVFNHLPKPLRDRHKEFLYRNDGSFPMTAVHKPPRRNF